MIRKRGQKVYEYEAIWVRPKANNIFKSEAAKKKMRLIDFMTEVAEGVKVNRKDKK